MVLQYLLDQTSETLGALAEHALGRADDVVLLVGCPGLGRGGGSSRGGRRTRRRWRGGYGFDRGRHGGIRRDFCRAALRSEIRINGLIRVDRGYLRRHWSYGEPEYSYAQRAQSAELGGQLLQF